MEQLAHAERITPEAAEQAVSASFESMTETLARSGRIEICGFGSFTVKDYEPYQGRNPRTGEIIQVEAKRLPVFKMGKELRERVNGGEEEQRA
jgi:integration host factor subunit beta